MATAPARIVFSIVVLSLVVCIFASMIQARPLQLLSFVNAPGMDFKDFYLANRKFNAGESLYAVERFVTPPLSAHILSPLSGFSLSDAIYAFAALNLGIVLGGILLARRCVSTGAHDGIRGELPMVLATACLSYPVIFLLQRGNIDGIVFGAVMLVFCFWRRWESLSGFFLAFAVALKVYPVLLVLPLLVERRWRALVVFFLALAAFVLVDYGEVSEFVRIRMFRRVSLFQAGDNMSFTASFYLVREAVLTMIGYRPPFTFEREAAVIAGCGTFAMLLGAALLVHLRSLRATKAAPFLLPLIYLPFLVAFPAQSYPYSQIFGLIQIFVLNRLWSSHDGGKDLFLLKGMAIALGLSMVHMFSLSTNLGYFYLFAIPATGNLCYLVMLLLYLARRGERRHAKAAA